MHGFQKRLAPVIVLLCFARLGLAQATDPAPGHAVDWELLADSVLQRAVTDGEIPGAAVVVVDRNDTLFSAGFGLASLDTRAAVTDATLFEVGSVGKVLTAIAVLQQVERGRLGLSADVNSHLQGWEVDSPATAPVTLHHLLTHGAGLNDRAIGYASREAGEVPGYLVETVTRTPFREYVASEILEPLGIVGSGYRPNLDGTVATGYVSRNDSFAAAPVVHRPVTPAGSFVASARDMARLLHALLNGGSPILSGESVTMMTEVRQTQHTRLMGNAYGLEESSWGDLRAFGKGGSIPGFVAYMALIPERDLGLFVAVNTSSDAAIDRFIVEAFDRLSSYAPELHPSMQIDVSRFAGEYRSNRYDRTSVEKLLRMEVHHIYATSDGDLALWHDGAVNTYQAIDSLVFQNVADTNRFLVFEDNEKGSVTHAFFNDRVAGGYLPVVWEKNGFWNSNQYVNEYFGVALLIALSYLLFPVVVIVRAIRHRANSEDQEQPGSRRWMNLTGVITSALLLAYVWFYFMPLLKARPDLIFGMPSSLTSLDILALFIVVGFATFAALWLHAVTRSRKSLPGLVVGFVYLASGVLVCEFFLRWNLL
jgi:CubicO group peptidase (beta-lactamase class C family)